MVVKYLVLHEDDVLAVLREPLLDLRTYRLVARVILVRYGLDALLAHALGHRLAEAVVVSLDVGRLLETTERARSGVI